MTRTSRVLAGLQLRSFLRPAPLALTTIVAMASCFHGERPPSVTPNSTLAIGGPDKSTLPSYDQPFGVVFASPRGETKDPSEITLVFNRPMRQLDLAGAEAPAPVQLEPAVPGRWQWVGTNGLVFVPQTKLPAATQFRVTVPAGTRALDGSVIDKPFEMRFETARPELVSTSPYEGDQHLQPDSSFTLRFNQPIAVEEAARAIQLQTDAKPPSPIAFDVKRPDPQNLKLLELRPKRPLPLGTRLVLTVDKSLRGTEGPLPSDKTITRGFSTYGPLRLSDSSCPRDTPHNRCAPNSTVTLRFSNAVRYNDARKAITVTPPVKIDWWDASDEDNTRYLHVSGRFAPATTYTIRIAGSLRDRYGQALGRDEVVRLQFDDLWPQAEIGVSGTYFDPKSVRDIAVASVNLNTLDLVTAPLDDASVGAVEWAAHNVDFSVLERIPGAKASRLRPAAAPNVMAKHLIEPRQVLGPAQRGPMLIGIRYQSQDRLRTDRRVVQVTDLGISAKVSRFGSLVWVTSLSTGKPVAGAEVRIRQPGGSAPGDVVARTDSDGMAVIEGDKLRPTYDAQKAPIIIVRSGDDWAYRNSGELLYSWRFGVSSDLSGTLQPFGMLFTERGVYRPGDSVQLKGILRKQEPRGTSTPAGTRVTVRVQNPSGDEMLKRDLPLSEFGTFATDIKVPQTSQIGMHTVEVLTAGTEESVAWTNFEVAEYRPAEFKVNVELDRRSYVRGDKAVCSAQGDYLFGAPMANAEVRTTVSRGPSYFQPPDTDGFSTRDNSYREDQEEWSPDGSQLQSGSTKLSSKGNTQLDVTLTMPGQQTTEVVNCEAEVMDLSRQTVASASSSLVHPGEFYLGIRDGDQDFVNAGQDIEPQIIAVSPDGKRRAGAKVQVDLIRRSWATVREAAGRNGYRSVTRLVDEPAGRCEVVTAAQPATCKLRIPKAGYLILRASSKDPRGNPVSASTSLYALGEGAVGWGDRDDMAVELVPDKPSYEVGQTARVLVKSPFPSAEALVTVERSGVYERRRMQLTGSMPTISIPITDDFRPNAYVSVVLVQGRTKAAPAQWNAADVGAPKFRTGYTNLLINPESRRLAVTVKPDQTDYRPGARTEVDIQVRDRKGQGARSEVTLYAVDEGVLMLTGYKTPDPIPVFTQPRALQVAYTEARSDLARLTLSPIQGAVGSDKGLEGGGGGSARKDFRQSAYFNPSIITDDKGHARVSFRLPESLTTYRIMAVVTAPDDRFGYAESRVTTSLPLLARPAFPRLLRTGDQMEAGVVVTNKQLGDRTRVDVRVVTDGLELLEAPNKVIELDKGQSEEVRFGFRANSAGQAKVRFTVEGGGESDAVEFGKTIQVPTSLEAVALYGQTRTESGEKLGDLSAIRGDVGALDISVASTALVGLQGSVEQLVDYPYTCTEQLTSRLVPLLPLRDLAREFDLPLPKNTDSLITSTVAQIVRRQRHDGGFGMWSESPQSHPWVSAYALWGLGEAQRRGVAVPESTLIAAVEYVRQYLSRWQSEPLGHATAAFMLDVLAEQEQPDVGYMNSLYEQRDKLPLFGKALLAHAMAIGKGDEKAIGQLTGELEAHLRVQGNQATVAENLGNEYAVLMDSSVRTTALVLRTLLTIKPQHPMAANLVRGLLSEREGGKWTTTQESAYALLALDQYRRAQEKQEPNFVAAVWVGDDQLMKRQFTGRSVSAQHESIPTARLLKASGSTLAFQMAGEQQGTLFYEARLKYARKQLPSQPLDRGFFIQKSMRVVSADGLAEAIRTVPAPAASWPEAKGGELVLVDLLVVSPQPHNYVVVDDPLPAGYEAVDTRLATTAASTSVPASGYEDAALDSYHDEDVEDRMARGTVLLPSWFRQEMRDDRVLYFVDHMAAGMYHYRYLARATTIGTFVMPATKAEAMYQPEIFGRTGASVVRVQAQ